MQGDRDLFGLALSRLREDLRNGRFKPGAPLLTTELAASLRISPTPVREALARLAGEGLVEDRRGRGAYALRYTAPDVEALYRLHGAYVALAMEIGSGDAGLDLGAVRGAPTSVGEGALRLRAEAFWTSLVQAADAEALTRVHQALTDQLSVVRLAEASVLDDLDTELGALEAAAEDPASRTLADAILTYHRRRRVLARRIASVVQSLGASKGL